MSRTPHDALFKRLFARREHVIDEARAVLPRVVTEAIDWGSLRRERAELVAPELTRRHADVFYRAQLADHGIDALVWLAFEHRSTAERWMALRLLRMNAQWWDRFRETNPKAHELPLFLPIVVHHDPRGWREPRRVSSLVVGTPAVKGALGAHVAELEIIVDDVGGANEDALAERTQSPFLRLGLWALRGRGAPSPDRLDAWVGEFRRLADAEDEAALETILRYHGLVASERSDALGAALKEVPRGREVYMRTIAEGYFERGREKGREEGLEQGREEGLEQGLERGLEEGRQVGRHEGRREVLRVLLEKRFGPLSPATTERIAHLTNGDFERYVERAVTAQQLEDVFRDD